jgi:hypothetical protein
VTGMEMLGCAGGGEERAKEGGTIGSIGLGGALAASGGGGGVEGEEFGSSRDHEVQQMQDDERLQHMDGQSMDAEEEEEEEEEKKEEEKKEEEKKEEKEEKQEKHDARLEDQQEVHRSPPLEPTVSAVAASALGPLHAKASAGGCGVGDGRACDDRERSPEREQSALPATGQAELKLLLEEQAARKQQPCLPERQQHHQHHHNESLHAPDCLGLPPPNISNE